MAVPVSANTRLIPGDEGKQGTPPWERWHGRDPVYTAKFQSGSALPAAIGVCPPAFGFPCTPTAVFARYLAAVTGTEPHPSTVAVVTEASAAAMQKGHDKEPMVRELVAGLTGVTFAPSDCYERVDAPWLRSSPDGEAAVTTVEGHAAVMIMEIKNKRDPPHGGSFPDAPDAQYYWQCIYNLYVRDADACLLVVVYVRDDAYLKGDDEERRRRVAMANAWERHCAAEGKPTTAIKMWTIYRNDAAVKCAIDFVKRVREVLVKAHAAGVPGILDPKVSGATFTRPMLAAVADRLRVNLTPGPASMGLYVPGFDTGHFARPRAFLDAVFGDDDDGGGGTK